jgi:RNA polymerase sigma-70 factor (ECF subfamily)
MGTPMRNDQHEDEEAVIRKCLAGDKDAYSVLVERYKSMAYNVAYRMVGDADTAKDLAQESFIAAYAGLERFQFNSKFSSWLYSIVLNKCRDHLRLAKDTVSTDDLAEVMPDKGISPEQATSAHQSSDLLQKALDALSPEHREVLILKHIEELDYQEIAAITGASVPALKVRAHRGREMLRKVLEKAGVTHG